MNLKLYYKILCTRIISKWVILSLDMFIVVFSLILAIGLQFNFSFEQFDLSLLGAITGIFLLVNTLFFHLMHTYVGVIRFSSFIDISRIFVALTFSYVILILLDWGYTYFFNENAFPVGIIVSAYIINFALMASLRIVVKLLYELIMFDREHCINVFIYGTKEAGINIAKSLRVNRNNHYRLCGFISDDKELIGKEMMGNKIYANNEKLFNILLHRNVQTIIVSPTKMKTMNSMGIVDRLLKHHIKLFSVPLFNELNFEPANIQLKQIQIEDLLERAPIQVDVHKIASHIEGKRVMITGAAGSIGSEIVRQVANFNPYLLILVDQAETPLHSMRLELKDKWRELNAETIVADVANSTRMEDIFRDFSPQYVFHAAAYKHVPMMEDNVSEAIQTNVLGTKIVADLAVKYNSEKFVFVSTDKAVNPTNVMGCSKRISEIYVQSLSKKLKDEGDGSVKFITTRFGNVLGSNGSVIPRFKEQIDKGGPVTVTHPEIIRYFMTIPEACRLVLEAGSMGNGGEIYIFDMGKPVKILDLAKRMISLSGRENIKIEFTGLRHGEKLYEELLNIKEQTLPTYHEKIMIAKVREYNYNEIKIKIQYLIKISYDYDPMQIVAAMKDIVPEFVSRNSIFEVLDKKEAETLISAI